MPNPGTVHRQQEKKEDPNYYWDRTSRVPLLQRDGLLLVRERRLVILDVLALKISYLLQQFNDSVVVHGWSCAPIGVYRD